MFSVVWEIEYHSQHLISGHWNDPDCVWEWRTEREQFYTRDEAEKKFRKLSVDDDTPIIRLNEVTYDKYGHEASTDMLEEIC